MNTDRINSAIKLLSNNLEKWRIASEQRGLNNKELQLNFWNIFSIFTFNELYLFAEWLLIA